MLGIASGVCGVCVEWSVGLPILCKGHPFHSLPHPQLPEVISGHNARLEHQKIRQAMDGFISLHIHHKDAEVQK